MRNRTSAASLAAVVLALSGCGSSNTASTTASTNPLAATTAKRVHRPPPGPPPKSATYSANLVGLPGFTPKGSGFAVITLNAHDLELCWTFSQLKIATTPTRAFLASHNISAPLGETYRTSGCNVNAPPDLFRIIEANPQAFDVVIEGSKNPEALVRGPLSL